MKVRYITEKDFVPTNITHAENHNEIEDGLFQIVYGVMQGHMNYDFTYDLIVRLSKKQKNEVVKRFMLLAWKEEVIAILNKLQTLDVNGFRVLVVIPFNDYVDDVPHTIKLFKLVVYIINEILEKGDAEMTTIDKPRYNIPSKNIQNLLGDYYVKRIKGLQIKGKMANRPYYRCLFFDEMIRRGMTEFKSDEVIVDPDTQKEIDAQELVRLTPSQYFNQPEKFFDIMDMKGDEWKKLKIKYELEKPGNSNNTKGSNSTSGGNDYTLGTVGTVFFMLTDISKEAVAKKNKKKLVAMMNYILGNEPNVDTPRSYIDKLLEVSAKSHSFKFYNWVKNNLGRFGFDVPDVIKEGWKYSQKFH